MDLDLPGTLAAAETELEALARARAEIDRKIAGLRLVVQGLRQMQGMKMPAGSEPEGLTGSCRAVLRSAPEPLSPLEVKEQLDAMGFDWSSYSSPISALHTVLKRLVKRGQALAADSDGKVRYCWKEVRVVVARREDLDDPARFNQLMQQIKQTASKEGQ